ncbi:MAG: hypothetical protein ACLFWB_11725 [Armatimonadota bacterium]
MKQRIFPEPEHTSVHAVEAAAGFIWAGCSRSPSLLLKISPDLQTIEPITFGPEGGLHDLAFDDRHLWVAHCSGHLSRVDPITGDFETHRIGVSSDHNTFSTVSPLMVSVSGAGKSSVFRPQKSCPR